VLVFKVTDTGLAVEPFDQLLKVYPELAVAVILTWVPALKLPVAGATLPPSPADAVKVYFGTRLLGVVLGDCESSFAQVRISSKDKYVKSFFILIDISGMIFYL
jgi:hypothetical protein